MTGITTRHKGRAKKVRRGITPWKKTALWFCLFFLLLAGALHVFRVWRSSGFEDQNAATRWGSASSYAQVSAFLPSDGAIKQEEIMELEYEINTALGQDSIKVDSDKEGARLWQDAYAGLGAMTISAGAKTVEVEAVGTGGSFFLFHPLVLSSGSYYNTSSIMKDDILLDQETAWRLFGSFDVVDRTVRVEDTNLRIAGVFKKEEGKLYEEAGMPACLVFVHYRTLVKYGSGGSTSGSGESERSGQTSLQNTGSSIPRTAAAPIAAPRLLAAEEGAVDVTDDGDGGDPGDSGGDVSGGTSDGSSGSGFDDDGGTGPSGTSGGAGASGASEGAGPESTGGGTGTNGAGGRNGSTGKTEGTGTGNTEYTDKGRITIYEIVMPDPVEGYAANKVRLALGEDTPAIVVDNTNRFGYASLWRDLRDYPLLGMRTQQIRLPYWENAARGYEAIFAMLFLAECILVGLTVLLIAWMIIHYIRHKTWTLLGNLRAVENSIYERQSRKRYPEYYGEKESGEEGKEEGKEEAEEK
ncbi:MAG: ABC transporter permease [Eubacteriales bacterium]|nr:ABC transporter permease [Eubacteriales bacterium]